MPNLNPRKGASNIVLKLAIDVDGVLANFCDSYAARLTARTGIPFPPASHDWPTVWAWDRAMGITPQEERYTWEEDILKSSNFWKNLDPLPNAKPAIRWLNRLTYTGNEVNFITNRIGKNAKLQTEKWLYNLGMNYPTVIVTNNKVPFLKALGINFFIDDKPETIAETAAATIPNGHGALPALPDLQRLYVKDCAYNREVIFPGNVLRAPDLLTALQESYGG